MQWNDKNLILFITDQKAVATCVHPKTLHSWHSDHRLSCNTREEEEEKFADFLKKNEIKSFFPYHIPLKWEMNQFILWYEWYLEVILANKTTATSARWIFIL